MANLFVRNVIGVIRLNDFWTGIESGYPLCCIIFFCDVWNPLRESHRMFHGKPECYDWNHNVGYIQCPECIIKEINYE